MLPFKYVHSEEDDKEGTIGVVAFGDVLGEMKYCYSCYMLNDCERRNIIMEDFKTIEGVTELFKKVNCIGNENCFFLAFKDTNREGMKYGLMGGAVGGVVAGIAAFTSGVANVLENNFDALLINQIENGIGIIPLLSKGIQMVLTPEKLETKLENFVFINNNDVEEIKIKGNIFNKNLQTLKIKIRGSNTLHLMLRVKEKSIQYQEENFTKFMKKYK